MPDPGFDPEEHIVIGLDKGQLDDIASRVGGRTLIRDPKFRENFSAACTNPRARFTISVDGLKGTATKEQILNAVRQGMARGTDAGFTNWELSMLYRHNRLPGATIIRGGKVIPNPFGK